MNESFSLADSIKPFLGCKSLWTFSAWDFSDILRTSIEIFYCVARVRARLMCFLITFRQKLSTLKNRLELGSSLKLVEYRTIESIVGMSPCQGEGGNSFCDVGGRVNAACNITLVILFYAQVKHLNTDFILFLLFPSLPLFKKIPILFSCFQESSIFASS